MKDLIGKGFRDVAKSRLEAGKADTEKAIPPVAVPLLTVENLTFCFSRVALSAVLCAAAIVTARSIAV
jgi:hypothetical protein